MDFASFGGDGLGSAAGSHDVVAAIAEDFVDEGTDEIVVFDHQDRFGSGHDGSGGLGFENWRAGVRDTRGKKTRKIPTPSSL